MKTKSLIIIAASFGIIGSAHAQDEKKGPHRNLPPEIIARFDKDGDGELNEEEREAAKAGRKEMMEARRKEMLEKFDTDKDGELSEAEKEAMQVARKQMMLEKFDKDGDGKLNDDEKAEMRKEMGPRRGGSRDGKGRKGGSRDGGAPKEEN